PGRGDAMVSEPFANRTGTRVGDRLSLAIGSSVAEMRVAGIYYDYSSSQGYVLVDRSTLLRFLPDQPPTNAAVYLEPGVAPAVVQHAIQAAAAGRGIVVAPNSALRRNAIAIFDRTFAITWALEAV